MDMVISSRPTQATHGSVLGSHHGNEEQQRKPSRRGRLCCALGTDDAQRAEDAGHDHRELELSGVPMTARLHRSHVESRRSSSRSRYGVAAKQKNSAQASRALPETECRARYGAGEHPSSHAGRKQKSGEDKAPITKQLRFLEKN